MRRDSVLLCLCIVMSLATADDGLGLHEPLEGVYRIYGGGLGDPAVPTPSDRKVMFAIKGAAAREIFDALGPDKKDVCTAQSKTRVRSRDDDRLYCMRSPKGEYSCNFGFDLHSGKSIGGIVC